MFNKNTHIDIEIKYLKTTKLELVSIVHNLKHYENFCLSISYNVKLKYFFDIIHEILYFVFKFI